MKIIIKPGGLLLLLAVFLGLIFLAVRGHVSTNESVSLAVSTDAPTLAASVSTASDLTGNAPTRLDGTFLSSPDAASDALAEYCAGKGFLQYDTHANRASIVPAGAGAPFQKAVRINIVEKPSANWKIQTSLDNDFVIHKGDGVVFSVYARAISPGVQGNLFIQEGGGPFLGDHGPLDITPGSEWQRYSVSMTAHKDFAPQQVGFRILLGFAPGTIELGGFQLQNRGRRTEGNAASARTSR